MFQKIKDLYKRYATLELLVIIVAAISYLGFKNLSTLPFIKNLVKNSFLSFHQNNMEKTIYLTHIVKYIISIVCLFIIPYFFSLIFLRKDKTNFPSLRLKFHKEAFLISSLFIAIMIIAILIIQIITPQFRQYYPMAKFAATSIKYYLLYSSLYVLFIFSWEYFAHSFLLFPFEKKLGKYSILISLLPFIILHFGKPLPEQFGSIVAGVALVLLARETRTFWYGAIIHGIIAMTMDISSVIFRLNNL